MTGTSEEFKVGDKVTMPNGTEIWTIQKLWFENFPAFSEPQQVAQLWRGISVLPISTRAAHLRHVEGSL